MHWYRYGYSASLLWYTLSIVLVGISIAIVQHWHRNWHSLVWHGMEVTSGSLSTENTSHCCICHQWCTVSRTGTTSTPIVAVQTHMHYTEVAYGNNRTRSHRGWQQMCTYAKAGDNHLRFWCTSTITVLYIHSTLTLTVV